VARLHVLHFKPTARAFNDFLLDFQLQLGLAMGAFNRFMIEYKRTNNNYFLMF
jgi:hypothetical protein